MLVGTSQPIDGCRRFSIDIPGAELGELLQPGRCGVWFRVFTGDEASGFTAVANTLKAPRWTPSLAGSLTTLVLDGGTAADVRFGEEHVRTVSGRVALGLRHSWASTVRVGPSLGHPLRLPPGLVQARGAEGR